MASLTKGLSLGAWEFTVGALEGADDREGAPKGLLLGASELKVGVLEGASEGLLLGARESEGLSLGARESEGLSLGAREGASEQKMEGAAEELPLPLAPPRPWSS
jgi:hypothetical protein